MPSTVDWPEAAEKLNPKVDDSIGSESRVEFVPPPSFLGWIVFILLAPFATYSRPKPDQPGEEAA